MSFCPLLALPEELVSTCVSCVAVGDILSCALACRDLHRHLRDRLEQHKNYHVQYRVCHDRLPLTVPTLLRLNLSNPEISWHIRSFDSWGIRPSFHTWTTWNSSFSWRQEEDESNWPEPAEDHSHLDESFFLLDELDSFDSIMRDTLHLEEPDLSEWQSAIREGDDEPLKAMLFALAPHMARLNFITYSPWQTGQFNQKHPLSLLCTSIKRIHALLPAGVKWPPGFASLRQVSICTQTRLRPPHGYFAPQLYTIAPLFMLPNIKILNLAHLKYMDASNVDFPLAEGSSSVEDLTFYSCDIKPAVAWRKLLLAPKKLVAFTCTKSWSTFNQEMCKILTYYHSNSLEHLSWDWFDVSVTALWLKCTRLRTLEGLSVTNRESAGSESLLVTKMREVMPRTIETLEILCSRFETPVITDLAEILRGVVEFVEDERFDNVKTVCLWSMAPGRSSSYYGSKEHDARYWAPVRRIGAKGINTHLYFAYRDPVNYSEHKQLHHDGSVSKGGIESEPDAK